MFSLAPTRFLVIRGPCEVPIRQNRDVSKSTASQDTRELCSNTMSKWQKRPSTQSSVTFFIIFFIFSFLFFLSTSLCFANRIKTLTKISFSEEKHFYRTKTATCFAANTQLKAEKKKIFTKYKVFFSIFVFVFLFFLQC